MSRGRQMKSTKAEKAGGLFELDPALSSIHRGLSVVCGQRTAMVLKKKKFNPLLASQAAILGAQISNSTS